MMNGATMPRASHARMRNEPATMRGEPGPGRDAPQEAVSTKLDLGESSRELGRLRRAGLDPDLARGARDLAEHGVGDGLAARRLLDRRGVELGDALEVVLAPGQLGRGGAHRAPCVLVAGEQLERGVQRLDLARVDRHLERDLVRQLGEPADVADDERLPERELADDAARRLAHRRRPQVDAARRTRP